MTRILVFVDESGTAYEKEEVFVCAAVWCAPETREGFQNTLRYTQERAKETIRAKTGKWPTELHYASGLDRIAYDLMQIVSECSLGDKSIRKTIPWNGQPLGITTTTFTPKAESFLRQHQDDFCNIMKTRAIINLLRPLVLYHGDVQHEVSVIIDSNTWKKLSEYCQDEIDTIVDTRILTVNFSCEDSKKVPGLQIADLVAGITRDNHWKGEAQDAYEILRTHFVERLETKSIKKSKFFGN